MLRRIFSRMMLTLLLITLLIYGLPSIVKAETPGTTEKYARAHGTAGTTSLGLRTVVTLFPIADSYVKSSSPDSNYGSETSIKTEITTGTTKNYTYTYVMFDLSSIPSDAVISSANLSLYMTQISGSFPITTQGRIYVHYCSDTLWTELGITCNNKPPFDPDYTSYNTFGPGPIDEGYRDWNVTSDVSRALSNGKLTEVVRWANYTSEELYGRVSSQSKEAGMKPKLTVEYLPGTEIEIAYDDGTIEAYTWWEGAGGIFAVRFTPPVSGQLKRCPFYIYSDPAAVKIHVMNSDKIDVVTPFIHDVTATGWINVDLLAYGVSVSLDVDFYIGLEWTMADAPTLGVDLSSPDSRSWKWNGVEWSLRSDRDYMIRAIVEVEGEEYADIDVDPMHLDFYAQTSTSTPTRARGNCCCSVDDNRTAYPVMRLDNETLQEWLKLYNNAPRAYIDSEFVPSTGSFSLLNHLEYIPSERDQGSCGNCWVWAGTGVLGVALDVQEGIKDRLSVQYFTSSWHGGTAYDWACCGGNIFWFAEWYQDKGFAIPWSNNNAYWQDGDRTCEDGTSVPADTIYTSPNYPLSRCDAETIETHGLGQAQAIANIKNVLHQNKSIYFGFSLPNSDDWNVFFNFWSNEPESAVWSPDYSSGHTWVSGPGEGGGHAVLCVGYNATDPDDSYWIMVNSWGTAGGGRPNGIFNVDMDINYDCWLNGFGYSLRWQTLDVDFEVGCQPITISNVGTADLEVTSIQCDQPWLSASPLCPPSFTVPPEESQIIFVTVDPTGLSSGTYYGNVQIYSNDPDENPVTVTVTLYVGALPSRFDFGTDSSPVETEYTRITHSTVYSASVGYGWDTSSELDSRDRGSPDNLHRDFVFSSSDHTFKVNLTNGDYLITVIVGDQSYPHDDINIYAEGTLKASISADAGDFIQEVFFVAVNDGLLDLLFHDGGGADPNWVVNALLIERYAAKNFDFGTEVSPVEPGYVQVTPSTAYSPSLGYGWTATGDLWSRDRLSPDNVRRDFIFSSINKTFKVDLPNGIYLVMVIVGDQSFMHDNICIYAEGTLKAEVSAGAGEFVQKVFVVSVADGALDLLFQDAGGSDSNWAINAVLIRPYYERKFDFGTEGSPVEPGYTQVSPSTSYSGSTGFGWANTAGLYARDRGAPDDLRRDLVFSASNRTVKIDLPYGKYMVVIIIGDNSYGHDSIDIYCEGILVVNDLTIQKGYFAEVAFLAEASDGQLEIMFCNDGGTDPNWVVNSIHVKTTFDLRLELDFGTSSSPVEDGYVRVTPATSYLPSTSYGWSDITSLWSRDRGAPDALKRDFVFSSSDRTFNIDLPNGQYQVTLTIGDQSFMHDKIDIYAESSLAADDVTVPAGTFTDVTFTVTVSDGQLNIAFHDDGGSDANWVTNSMTIESYLES